MLKKLIKYEFRATRSLCLWCIIAMVIMTVLGAVLIVADGKGEREENRENPAITTSYVKTAYYNAESDMSETEEMMQSILVLVRIVYSMVCVAVLIAISFVVTYYFFYRYYKNYFTDEGYLMHTLPVTSGDLINSKLIVACFWQYLTGFVFVVMMAVLMAVLINKLNAGNEFREGLAEAWQSIQQGDFDVNINDALPAIVCLTIASLLGPIPYNLFMYVAVGLGQKSKTHKLASSIGMLFVMFIIQRSVLGSAVSSIRVISLMSGLRGFEKMINNPVAINLYGIIYLAGTIAVAFGLYMLNKYLLEKQLNLE